MPELSEQMYCSQQIVVPPNFPYILKKYAKAAIKTQPYDLLRWSFEYFRAIAERKTPPVKLRLEYPVFSTEGGLTRGYLKVFANQLADMDEIPLSVLKATWQGACLDAYELKRILCLCEAYLRQESVPRLHFLAVAGGLLTKSLTHTMILLCETLTKEPDGGSAAIPLDDFITMYKFLTDIDASTDTKYVDGYREGCCPEEHEEEEEYTSEETRSSESSGSSDSFWPGMKQLKRLMLINDNVALSPRLSMKLNMPIIGKLERSPSVERAGKIERENIYKERRGRLSSCPDVDEKLRAMSSALLASRMAVNKDEGDKEELTKIEEMPQEKEDLFKIMVFNEDDNPIPYEIFGEPEEIFETEEEDAAMADVNVEEQVEEVKKPTESDRIALYVADAFLARSARLEDLITTFEDIANIVDKYNAVHYDLGVIAGRQMSSTSGEFVSRYIERDIMDFINEQIAILPDPDLKKKKAKPEEVAMIKEMLEQFLTDNMDIIVPEVEEAEEEELPIPEFTHVYAVPGIGPVVDEDIVKEFLDYAMEVCKVQSDLFMPRNIRHFMCPPLEKFAEPIYVNEHLPSSEIPETKEEVPHEAIIME